MGGCNDKKSKKFKDLVCTITLKDNSTIILASSSKQKLKQLMKEIETAISMFACETTFFSFPVGYKPVSNSIKLRLSSDIKKEYKGDARTRKSFQVRPKNKNKKKKNTFQSLRNVSSSLKSITDHNAFRKNTNLSTSIIEQDDDNTNNDKKPNIGTPKKACRSLSMEKIVEFDVTEIDAISPRAFSDKTEFYMLSETEISSKSENNNEILSDDEECSFSCELSDSETDELELITNGDKIDQTNIIINEPDNVFLFVTIEEDNLESIVTLLPLY